MHFLLVYSISAERSAFTLMGITFYIIFFLCFKKLIYINLIILYFGTYYYYLSFVWYSLHFLGFVDYFLGFVISFPMLGKFSFIIFSNIYSDPFSSFGNSVIQMLVHLILSQSSLKLSSFLFIFFLSSSPYQLFPAIYLLVDLFILLLHSTFDSF